MAFFIQSSQPAAWIAATISRPVFTNAGPKSPCSKAPCDVLGWPQGCTALEFGRYALTRLPTPGHTPEAVSLLLSVDQQLAAVFCGDVLLPGGVGRTDLPGGDISALADSVRLLAGKVAADTLLLSSHDYAQRFFTCFNLAIAEQPLLRQLLDNSSSDWQQQLQQCLNLLKNSAKTGK